MEPTDLTIEILKDIRAQTQRTADGLEKTNLRLDGLRDEVDQMRSDLGDRLSRLEQRQTEDGIRLATEVVALGGTLREVRDLFLEDRALRRRVDDHERRLAAIERGGRGG